MSTNDSNIYLTSVMAVAGLGIDFHPYATKDLFEVCIIPTHPLEVLQIFASVHADEDEKTLFHKIPLTEYGKYI